MSFCQKSNALNFSNVPILLTCMEFVKADANRDLLVNTALKKVFISWNS